MKKVNQMKGQKGQTLLEIIAVLVIIGTILAAVIPAVTSSTDNGRIRSAVSAIRSIQSAAVGYYNDNGGSYASVSIAGLAAKYLPAGFSGTSANPWNGNITVAVNGAAINQYVLTMTDVPSSAQNPLTIALQNSSVSTNYNATTNTFTATLS
jgi:prepilin-type N-terminal cleavage/methylation domain-containing protein